MTRVVEVFPSSDAIIYISRHFPKYWQMTTRIKTEVDAEEVILNDTGRFYERLAVFVVPNSLTVLENLPLSVDLYSVKNGVETLVEDVSLVEKEDPETAGAGIDEAEMNAYLQSSSANVFWNGSEYPLRNTVTEDSGRRVIWIGPSAPTIGSGYAITGVDKWEKTT